MLSKNDVCASSPSSIRLEDGDVTLYVQDMITMFERHGRRIIKMHI